MTRFSVRSVSLIGLLAAAVGCSSVGTEQVGVTNDAAVVAGCQKVGDVAASSSTPAPDVNEALERKARSVGANYVLVASDNARTGAAYKCSAPSAAPAK